jgi:hypothetical protein
MSKMKSFRGMLDDGEQEKISLQTNNGLTGYQIKKFQIMPKNFNVADEYTVQIWKTEQTTIATNQDFSDNRLLGVAYFGTDSADLVTDAVVIFDNEKFNQDVYVVAKSQSGNEINYYIEMEQMKLSLDEQTVATLKDIRNSN